MGELSTGYISGVFGSLVNNADDKVSTFITDHTGTVDKDGKFTANKTGTLIMSASDSLSLQQLMADQSIAAQTSTTTLKSIKDSISTAARNI